MFSWATRAAQTALSSVAGTAEPIYGPEAFHSVAKTEDQNPEYEITPEDLKWQVLETTCAETATFYIESDSGYLVMVQAIYSNVANLHVTTQFNVKIFHDGKVVWSPQTLNDYRFDDQKRNYEAENFKIELSESNDSYKITSTVDPNITVDLTVTRTAPGFKVGKDGQSRFGDDPENPWGSIRHIFWPKAKAEGTITHNGEKIDMSGKAIYILALQGMKPHHAAARWNFVNFQGPTLNAVMMEFTTPPSYGTSTVNVSCVLKDDALLTAGTTGTIEYTRSELDEETQWPEPKALKAQWKGKTKGDKKDIEATVEVELAPKLDRVDIMAEVPQIIKKFVAGAVGTRPYIYQFKQNVTLKLKIGDQIIEEEGSMFAEATFIS